MDCDLFLKNSFSMGKTKKFWRRDVSFLVWKELLTVGAGREWNGLPWEGVTFLGIESRRLEAGNCLLEGGRKIHWVEHGTW